MTTNEERVSAAETVTFEKAWLEEFIKEFTAEARFTHRRYVDGMETEADKLNVEHLLRAMSTLYGQLAKGLGLDIE